MTGPPPPPHGSYGPQNPHGAYGPGQQGPQGVPPQGWPTPSGGLPAEPGSNWSQGSNFGSGSHQGFGSGAFSGSHPAGSGSFRTSGSARFRGDGGPQRIGHYAVMGLLGRGGVGSVYRVRAPDGGVFALKLLNSPATEGPRAKRFEREARVLSRLEHPQIVPMRDFGRHGNSFYLVTDVVEGEDLDAYARRNQLSPTEASRLVAGIGRIVGAAHAGGVIHRDLKPSNIRVDHLGKPYLLDFGLAFELGSVEQLTQSGAMVGTPAYMPPELISSKHGTVGPQTDVYGLGMILLELLTGEVAFPADSAVNYLYRVMSEDPPGPRQRNSEVPHSVDAICRRALARNAKERFPNALAFAEALEEAVATAEAPATASRWPLLLAGVALGALLMGGVAWTLRGASVAQVSPVPSPSATSTAVATPAPPASPESKPTATPSAAASPRPSKGSTFRGILAASSYQASQLALEACQPALEGDEPRKLYLRGLLARAGGRWGVARETLSEVAKFEGLRARGSLAFGVLALRRKFEGDEAQQSFRQAAGAIGTKDPGERCAARLAQIYLRSSNATGKELAAASWPELQALLAEGLPSDALEVEFLGVCGFVAREAALSGEATLKSGQEQLARLAPIDRQLFVPRWDCFSAGDRAVVRSLAGQFKPALQMSNALREAMPDLIAPYFAELIAFARQGRMHAVSLAMARLRKRGQELEAQRPGAEERAKKLSLEWFKRAYKRAGGDHATFAAALTPGMSVRVRVDPKPGRVLVVIPINAKQKTARLEIACQGADIDMDLFLRFDLAPRGAKKTDYAANGSGRDELLVIGPRSKSPLRAGVYCLVVERARPVPHAVDVVIRARMLPEGYAPPPWKLPWVRVNLPAAGRPLFAKACQLEARGQLPQTVDLLAQLKRKHPETAQLHAAFLGRCGRWAEVLQIAKSYEKRKEGLNQIWLATLATRALRSLGKIAGALNAAEQLLKVSPDLVLSQLERLECLLLLRRTAEAEALAKELLAKDAYLDDARVRLALAVLQRDAAKGLLLLAKLAKNPARGPRARRDAIRALLARGALKPAREAITKMGRLSTPIGEALRAELLYREGKKSEAQKVLSEKVGQAGASPESVVELTRVKRVMLGKKKGK